MYTHHSLMYDEISFLFERSFETHLSRVEAELLRREAPPSYGQLIAQGLIPPVEDFPVCSPNQVRFQKSRHTT